MTDPAHYRGTRDFFRFTAATRQGFYDAESGTALHHTWVQLRVRSLVTRELERILAREPGCRRLVDVGCGRGDFTLELARRFPTLESLTGLDFSVETLAIARDAVAREGTWASRVTFQEADILDLPGADRSSCITLCINMLHHVHPSDQPRALAGLARVTDRFLILEIKNRHNVFYPLTGIHRSVGNGVKVYPTTLPTVTDELARQGFRRVRDHGFFGLQVLSPISLAVFAR